MSARTIHPFPARMAPQIAMDFLAVRERGKSLTVLDPMCGSGTVLSVAVERGHTAIGFDLDPLAVLMTQVATARADTSLAVEAAVKSVSRARRFRSETLPWDDKETIDFADFWFAEPQRIQLAKLSRSINELDHLGTRRILQIALSRTIVTKSPKASLAGDTSHSRPHRVITSSNYDVMDGFLKSIAALSRLLGKRRVVGSATANLGDSRSLASLPDHSVDIVITSPPYLNAIDYLRGHKLSLIWLGYTIPRLRQIRAHTIGADRALTEKPSEHAIKMVAGVVDSVTRPENLPLPTITRYANDACQFAIELFRVTRPESRVVIVVGNSTLKGNFIRNDDLVSQALLGAGFSSIDRVERDLPENKRYMPITTSGTDTRISKRMRTEVVLTVGKS